MYIMITIFSVVISRFCQYKWAIFLLAILVICEYQSKLFAQPSQFTPTLSSGYPLQNHYNVKLTKLTQSSLKSPINVFIIKFSGNAQDFGRLVEAIRKAEGIHSKHPYGILKKYKHTNPKQACLNTIQSAYKRFRAESTQDNFLTFLSRSYAPLGANNDHLNLNSNWIHNVTYFYNNINRGGIR